MIGSNNFTSLSLSLDLSLSLPKLMSNNRADNVTSYSNNIIACNESHFSRESLSPPTYVYLSLSSYYLSLSYVPLSLSLSLSKLTSHGRAGNATSNSLRCNSQVKFTYFDLLSQQKFYSSVGKTQDHDPRGPGFNPSWGTLWWRHLVCFWVISLGDTPTN